MASPKRLIGEAWLPFGRAAGAQVGQAIMLARTQAELQENEARFRSIIESTSDVIIVLSANRSITYVSPSVERVLGYRPASLVGTNAFALLHPDDTATAMQSFALSMNTTEVSTNEFRIRHASGSWRHIEATSRAVNLNGTDLKLISTLRDLTERKQAEKAALDAAIKTDSTLRANEERFRKELEAFSYSVSHDLRAPLRAINGLSRILLEDHTALLPPEGQRYLELVHDNARRMDRLIDDLLNFSRLSGHGILTDQVQPATLVREALDDMIFDREGRSVEVVVGDLLPCRADVVLLKQLFVNLLSNALKFTRQRAVAHIEIGCSIIDGDVVYFVKDDGAGFDMQYADKLFGVFQRLHRAEDFEGTGVGLAIVQRIVQRHGGRIWAHSALDQGATFSFTLENAHTDAQERATRNAA
jgi:PAS domain S-box-containing protein